MCEEDCERSSTSSANAPVDGVAEFFIDLDILSPILNRLLEHYSFKDFDMF